MSLVTPVVIDNNGSSHQQTFAIQPVKVLNSTSATNGGNNIQSHQTPPTQTVVISSNNISSSPFLPGIQPHAPISFATATPTTITPNNLQITSSHNGVVSQMKKEQDGHISSTTMTQSQRRIMQNSFDIMNPLVIDEGAPAEPKKIKQPPMVFRSGTREVHNKLEKCRRAHLKECFDILKKQLPANGEEKKTSNLSILHSALKYIQLLKRRESEYEHQLERLAREKIANQQRLATLKKDSYFDGLDFSKQIHEISSNLFQKCGTKRDSVDGLITTSPIPSSSVNSSGHIVSSPTYRVIDSGKIINHEEDSLCEFSDDPSTSSLSNLGNGNHADTVTDVPVTSSSVINQNSVIAANGENKISIPILGKGLPIVTTTAAPQSTVTKEVTQPVQTAGISVLPMPYPVNQGLVLQKVAIVPHKGLTDLTPLVSTHFITTPQQLNGINGQINGKVVPLTQYIVKPMVVVSTASPRPGS
ncbi:hypothetical protein ABEB36_006271 [Hypothenemus hampei]|uniref:Max-binding protein MNT n=1 Tax=Hypothenemus hampei TaxID=57062 RepID=A0ABD1EPZ6_HYPHA